MPATLEGADNRKLMNIINGMPYIDLQESDGDNDAFDAYVEAIDAEIIQRFGPHPAVHQPGYSQRLLALAEVVAIDMQGGVNRLAQRTRVLSRVGIVGMGPPDADGGETPENPPATDYRLIVIGQRPLGIGAGNGENGEDGE